MSSAAFLLAPLPGLAPATVAPGAADGAAAPAAGDAGLFASLLSDAQGGTAEAPVAAPGKGGALDLTCLVAPELVQDLLQTPGAEAEAPLGVRTPVADVWTPPRDVLPPRTGGPGDVTPGAGAPGPRTPVSDLWTPVPGAGPTPRTPIANPWSPAGAETPPPRTPIAKPWSPRPPGEDEQHEQPRSEAEPAGKAVTLDCIVAPPIAPAMMVAGAPMPEAVSSTPNPVTAPVASQTTTAPASATPMAMAASTAVPASAEPAVAAAPQPATPAAPELGNRARSDRLDGAGELAAAAQAEPVSTIAVTATATAAPAVAAAAGAPPFAQSVGETAQFSSDAAPSSPRGRASADATPRVAGGAGAAVAAAPSRMPDVTSPEAPRLAGAPARAGNTDAARSSAPAPAAAAAQSSAAPVLASLAAALPREVRSVVGRRVDAAAAATAAPAAPAAAASQPASAPAAAQAAAAPQVFAAPQASTTPPLAALTLATPGAAAQPAAEQPSNAAPVITGDPAALADAPTAQPSGVRSGRAASAQAQPHMGTGDAAAAPLTLAAAGPAPAALAPTAPTAAAAPEPAPGPARAVAPEAASATPAAAPEAPAQAAPIAVAPQPPLAPAAPPPVQATAETAPALAQQIVRRLDARVTRFDVVLAPEGLGPVSVKVEIAADGALSADLRCADPTAAPQLQARAEELRQALSQAGVDVAQARLTIAAADPAARPETPRSEAQQPQSAPQGGAGGQSFAGGFGADGQAGRQAQHAAPAHRPFAFAAEAAEPQPLIRRAAAARGVDVRI